MPDINYTGTLKGSDGSILTITNATLTITPAPTGPTGPTGASGPAPAAVNVVKVGTASYPVAATNPAGAEFPGGRGPDQLVIYRAPVGVTVTNAYGAEVPVTGGVTGGTLGTLRDRLPTLDGTGTTVPDNGFVLSGHGAARDFLLANATSGTNVQLSYVKPADVPTPKPTTRNAKTLAVYLMLWPGSGVMDNVPSQCNEVRLAFAQSSPPTLVGWTSDGVATLTAKLAAFRAKGGRVLISIGGQGGHVNTSARTAFIDGIGKIRSALGGNVDGIDWDIEASAMNASDVTAISAQLFSTYGAGWRTTFAPNGGNVGQYLPAAVACERAGCLTSFGQQFYDAPVSVSAALSRVQQAISLGIPASKITVGMMIQNDSSHWTVQQCIDNYKTIKAAVPGIGGAYLWETRRDGTSQWAAAMAPLVLG